MASTEQILSWRDHQVCFLRTRIQTFPECLDVLLQGPALYSFNDARFSDADWTGIRMLSQSVKQPDRFKVGYFGMGFKSVFHITGQCL